MGHCVYVMVALRTVYIWWENSFVFSRPSDFIVWRKFSSLKYQADKNYIEK